MGHKILIPQDIAEEGKVWLRKRGYEIKMGSGATRECMTRMALHAAQGIDEVLTGKRPTWPVNEITKRRSP